MASIDNRSTTPNDDIEVVDRYLRAVDEDADSVEPYEMAMLEADFVEAAPRFARCYIISAGAWKDVGVPADLIQRAGLDQ